MIQLRERIVAGVRIADVFDTIGDGSGGVIAVDMLDEGEGGVDGGGDAGAREDVAVADPAGVADPADLGPQGGGLVPRALVGGGAPAIQHARPRRQPRPRAHCHQVLQSRVRRVDEVDVWLDVRCRRPRAQSARHEKDVQVFRCVGECVRG